VWGGADAAWAWWCCVGMCGDAVVEEGYEAPVVLIAFAEPLGRPSIIRRSNTVDG
jgi:hypothetical protein